MCFGNSATTETKNATTNQTVAPPSWLSGAAQNNVNFASGLQSTGFTPYTGNQVASFSPQQQQSFGLGTDIGNSAGANIPLAGQAIANYTTAGPQSVSPETISSQMSPYMNQYVAQALAPQLEQLNQQFATQNKGYDAGATGAGAYGDTSWALGKTNLTQQQDTARTGLIGNAYNAAFNTAIGAGAQDVANNLSGQTTNANLAETALGRQLTGANAIYGQATGAANLNNTLGAQQTAQQQAALNAAYNQWQMAQQYPFQTTQLMDQALTAGKAGAPITTTGTTNTTTASPDNSGYGMIGALGSVALAPFTGGLSLAALPGAVGSMGGGSGANLQGVPSPNGPGTTAIGYADGGSPPVGVPSVVGERGPELFVPHQSGTVIPYEVLKAALDKRQGGKPTDGIARQLGIAA